MRENFSYLKTKTCFMQGMFSVVKSSPCILSLAYEHIGYMGLLAENPVKLFY